jgi:hypothetical protein
MLKLASLGPRRHPYGPQAVDTRGAKRSKHHRHNCIGDMYDTEVIIPQMIAYSAVGGMNRFHIILLHFNHFLAYPLGSIRALI